MAGGTAGTDLGVAPVLPVSVPVGGAVGQHLELRTNHTVIVLVIHILPPLVATLHGLGPLIGGGEHPFVSKYFFADVRGLIRGIGNNRLYFRKIGCHTVIDLVKDHAVMYIAGGNHGFQHKAVFVAGGVGLIGKLPLVLPLRKQAAVRVGHAPGRGAQLFLLPPGQLLFGGVISGLLS